PEYIVERASKILNKFKKAMNGAKILVLGVAFKQDIDDYRESPALKVIELFEKDGSKVDYYDKLIQKYWYKGEHRNGLLDLTGDIIKGYDLVVITT
ncbi:MAG: UDP binding domain-containing protein, partial [Oscillospiraceae bacterium]